MSVTEYINREAPDIEARKLGLIDTAKALTEKGYTLPDFQQAAFTPAQQLAFQNALTGIGAYEPFLQKASLSTDQATNLLAGATGAPTSSQIAAYSNPFQQQVIDTTLAELDKRAALQRNQLAGDAVRGGVFGGSRFGVAEAELAKGQQDARASALANLNLQNFQQAQQAALNQLERERAIGLGIGALGAQQASLGQQAHQFGQSDIQNLLGIGALQQQFDQSGLDLARQNQLQRIMQPYQQLGFYGDILQGAPTSSQVMSTMGYGGGGPSPIQAALGTGLGAFLGIGGLRRSGVI